MNNEIKIYTLKKKETKTSNEELNNKTKYASK